MTTTTLLAFLEQRKDDILRTWQRRVIDTLVPSSVPRAELVNTLPLFFDEMLETLRRDAEGGGEPPPSGLNSLGREHGRQRLHMGFDVAGVVREYGLLRECVFELLDEAGLAVSLAEFRTFSRCLDTGVTEAVAQYALERDEELRKKTGKYVGFLAHELRNPLNSARLAVAILRDGGALGEAREAAMLERNLDRLQRLIDESLVEGKLQAGIDVRPEPTLVCEMLSALEAECAVDADRRRIALRLHCDDGLVVPADARYLHSALSNLVRNALKFTHEGGAVTVRARRADGRVLVEVEDECGGLPHGAVDKLFDPFVQVGADRSGFGLGLAIAKQAVEAHGGALRVHDLPGRGCVFSLELPTSAVASG